MHIKIVQSDRNATATHDNKALLPQSFIIHPSSFLSSCACVVSKKDILNTHKPDFSDSLPLFYTAWNWNSAFLFGVFKAAKRTTIKDFTIFDHLSSAPSIKGNLQAGIFDSYLLGFFGIKKKFRS